MSYFDISDAEGVDFGDWVDEHEEDRRELASLEAAGPWSGDDTEVTDPDLSLFDAADGGEETDDMPGLIPKSEQKYLTADEAGQADERDAYLEHVIEDFAREASAKLLRRAMFTIEREVERRKSAIKQEAKELEAFDKPIRATRSDAGKPREKKEAAA
jgi:hypothetical protein